jgi:CRP/FNR family cyclic AMP-dependent transcriptional regulator
VFENVGRAGMFADLGSRDVTALTQQLRPVAFPRGHTIFSQGQPAECLYIIETGKVKVGRVTAQGRTQLIAVLGPADVFGELAVVDAEPRSFSVTTLTNVYAAAITRAALQRWMTERPEIAGQLLRLLTRRLRRTNDVLSDQIYTDLPGRIAKQLLYLAQRFGITDGAALRVDHELSQTELAQLVGSTRESVNTALVDFTERGWIRTSGKRVFIYDSERLAQRAK